MVKMSLVFYFKHDFPNVEFISQLPKINENYSLSLIFF